MMKSLLISLLLTIFSLTLFADIEFNLSNKVLSITGDTDYSLKEKKSGLDTYIKININNSGHYSKPGEPDIPSLTKLVLLPSEGNFVIKDISYEFETKKLDRPLIPMGWEENLDKNKKFYSKNQWFPKEIIKISKPVIMRNYRFSGITVFPIKYNPKKNEIRILKNIKIKLTIDKTINENVYQKRKNNLYSESFYQIAKNNILGVKDKKTKDNEYGKNYLFIIDSNSHLELLNPLIDLKRKLGYRIYTATLQEIGSDKEDIKNYIQNAYDNWEFPPQNVILFGDTQGSFTMPSYHITGTYTPTDVTDLPYSLLSGDDYFPDIMLGRISIRTDTQLSVIMNKIIKYQTDPPMNDDWFSTAVMGADTGNPWEPYMNLMSAKDTKELVKEKLLSYGYNTVHTFYAPENTNLTIFRNYINQGCSLVNYRGFGSPQYWTASMLEDYMFSIDDIWNLSNGFKLPFITSIVCGGGDFETSDVPMCFGETWLIAGTASNPKGAIGFIGPSEHDTKTWFNNANDSGIYQGITKENLQTGGQMLLRGKMELYRNFPFGHDMGDSHVSDQFYFYVYNLLGDPDLTVWTDTPKLITSFIKDEDENGSLRFHIDCNSPEKSGFLVSITNDDSLIAIGYSDENGDVEISESLTSGNYTATVSKKGYRPQSIDFVVSNQLFELTQYQIEPDFLSNGVDFSIDAVIKNVSGNEIENISLSAVSESELVSITSQDENLELFQPDEEYSFNISGQIADFWKGFIQIPIKIKIIANDITYLPLTLNIHSPLVCMEITQESYILNNTQNFSMQLNLKNNGDFETGDFIGELQVLTNGITVNTQNSNGNNIFPNEVGTVDFDITTENFNYGDVAYFNLLLYKETQLMQILNFSLPIIEDLNNAPTISYGYAALESTDNNSLPNPSYDWVEISQIGQIIAQDHYNSDGYYTYIDLPFSVNYFGRLYDRITFSSAGWISMGEAHGIYFRNRTIPSGAGPDAMIAVFWDRFNQAPSYKYYDEENNRFILEWHNVGNSGSGGNSSFQVILYPSVNGKFSDILMQYNAIHDFDSEENYSTTGIESPDQEKGLLIQFAHTAVPTANIPSNNTAILFTSVENLSIPKISCDISELSFNLNNPTSQEFEITLTNDNEEFIGGRVYISYENGHDWLIANQDTFLLSQQTSLNFTIDTSALIPSQYKAYIEILTDYQQLLVIPINLEILMDTAENTIIPINGINVIYPNPFYLKHNSKDGIKINYSLSKNSYVDISVYNIKGQFVNKIISRQQSSGQKSVIWNLKNYDGKAVSNGLYLYKMVVDKKIVSITKGLILK